jgi:ABC-type antimicrobial peptide transport system permease subunit
VERVSGSYFPLLRATAVRGRLPGTGDDDATRPAPVVVLGHQLWVRRYSSDTGVIGRTIRLNGVPLTVIGVMRPGFTGLSGRAELWVPRTLSPQITYAEYLTTNQNFISAVGRLRAGTSLEAARSELAVLGATVNRALPSDPDHPEERVSATAISLNEARIDPVVRRSLFIVLAAMALLHLLACANVINLLLGREAQRQRESSVRLALGAARGNCSDILFAGNVVPGLAGGALGLLLAGWGSALITARDRLGTEELLRSSPPSTSRRSGRPSLRSGLHWRS